MYKIKVGISACLLGQEVRFDGGHKRSSFCERDLGAHFEYHPVCPEMAIGLGAPRAAIRLVKRHGEVRAEASNGSFDVTDKLIAFSEQKASQLDFLSGYILCAKSPSCGMERVRIYGANNEGSAKEGIGLFAKALMEANPLLPVEEDGRLCDPILRENFVLRVFAYHDWQQLCASGITAAALIRFHSRYKYLVLSHATTHYRTLGKLLGNLGKANLQEVADSYIKGLMAALTLRANRRSHTNVLMHLQGYFKRVLTPAQKQELADTIDKYRTGIFPLLVPLTLIRHYLREYPNTYLAEQVYLNPHPDTLKLRYGL
ncbi:YbgA family protein [Aeromonas rivipollensis]|uniref:YbgA family protein n=1 Tax=Aeromonas rivipollensis TaxID=948519 RepID=UPI000FAD0071